VGESPLPARSPPLRASGVLTPSHVACRSLRATCGPWSVIAITARNGQVVSTPKLRCGQICGHQNLLCRISIEFNKIYDIMAEGEELESNILQVAQRSPANCRETQRMPIRAARGSTAVPDRIGGNGAGSLLRRSGVPGSPRWAQAVDLGTREPQRSTPIPCIPALFQPVRFRGTAENFCSL
jgi:hypothetical protein